ncbi:MAG: sterol desaturase family protein [Rhodospirillales bacterium]
MSETAESSAPAGPAAEWNWRPALPLQSSPLCDWPPRPLAFLAWTARVWLPMSEHLVYAGLALAVCAWLTPPLHTMTTPEAGWIASVWARNLIMFAVWAGFLHGWFYVWRIQGGALRFDRNEPLARHKMFLFGYQVHDNMFWALAGGVTVWTFYECLMWLAFANGVAPMISFSENPVWFAALFVLIPIGESVHFYAVHRLLHWRPLYRLAHALHHRNTSVGPWSGISMHPVEHLLYFSSVFVHLVIPSHPAHVVFHMCWLTLGAASSHSGYQALLAGPVRVPLGTFFHQLHHRYFECNYGNTETPVWDRLAGSFHDGTPEAARRVRAAQTARNRAPAAG